MYVRTLRVCAMVHAWPLYLKTFIPVNLLLSIYKINVALSNVCGTHGKVANCWVVSNWNMRFDQTLLVPTFLWYLKIKTLRPYIKKSVFNVVILISSFPGTFCVQVRFWLKCLYSSTILLNYNNCFTFSPLLSSTV